MLRAELEALTVKELRQQASERGIVVSSKATKTELITALLDGQHTSRRPTRRSSFTAPVGTTPMVVEQTPTVSSSSSLVLAAIPSVPPTLAHDPGLPIPPHYGQDRLVLMVQDPRHIFAYWELQADTIQRVAQASPGGATPVLLVTVSGASQGSWSREVDLRGGNYYLAVEPNLVYQAELALRDASGQHHPLARSNKVQTPAATISPHQDEHWMIVEESFDELLELAGLPNAVGEGSSTQRLAEQRRQAWIIQQADQAAQQAGGSSGQLSSSARWSQTNG